MLTHNIDKGRKSFLGVMQVCDGVTHSRAKVKQRRSRFFSHPGISVSSTRSNTFEQAKNTAHLWHAVQRCYKVHFRRTWIRKTDIDVRPDQTGYETLGPIHTHPLTSYFL